MSEPDQAVALHPTRHSDVITSDSPPAGPLPFRGLTSTGGLFNSALWLKAVRESWALLLALSVLIFGFAWIYVWLISKMELPAFLSFLTSALKDFENLSTVPFAEVATPPGRVALAFVHPLVQLVFVVWAIARGSDMVAGELERGTLEMLVAQPLGRWAIFVSKLTVAVLGLLVLTMALWAGIAVGIRVVVPNDPGVTAGLYLPAALNVFGLGIAVLGIATLFSAVDRYRWRTIGIVGSVYALSIVTDVIARMARGWEWIRYFSIFTPFEPQTLVARPEQAWSILAQHNGVLLLLGAVCFLAAGVTFARRDLPAPL